MKGIRWAVGAVVGALAVTGCGPTDANGDGIADGVREPDTVSLVAPSTPVGSVSGKILTTRLTPLDGAAVTLNVLQRPDKEGARAPISGVTDAEGGFFIPGVPAGVQVEVTVKKDGFATLRTVTTVPASAGNFPINDGNAQVGPYAVTELTGSIRFNIFTRTGRPAANLRVVVEAAPAASALLEPGQGAYGAPVGVVVSEGTVNASGQVVISSLPGAEEVARLGGLYTVIVPSFDENGDGIVDSAGQVLQYSGNELVVDASSRTLVLADARTSDPLQILSSNVRSVQTGGSLFPTETMVRPTEALIFAFNHALVPNSMNVVVTNEAGNELVPTTAALSSDGTVVSAASGTPWVDGKEYNVLIRGTSADTGEVVVRRGYFWGGDPNAPGNLTIEKIEYVDDDSNSRLSFGDTVYVFFSSAIVPRNASEPIYLYAGHNFGGSATVGDSPYEIDAPANNVGFGLAANEPFGPDAVFSPPASTYTSRWSFEYPFGSSDPLDPLNLTDGTAMRVDFARLKNAGGGYYSIWGGLLTSNLSGTVTRRSP